MQPGGRWLDGPMVCRSFKICLVKIYVGTFVFYCVLWTSLLGKVGASTASQTFHRAELISTCSIVNKPDFLIAFISHRVLLMVVDDNFLCNKELE